MATTASNDPGARTSSFSSGGVTASLVLFALLVADVALVRFETAVLATAAMAIGVFWLAGAAGFQIGHAWKRPEAGSGLKLELFLVLGLAGFTVARGIVAFRVHDFSASAIEAHAEAARLYDLAYAAFLLAAELVLWRAPFLSRAFHVLGARPQLLLATAFAAMIAAGTLALCLPWFVREVHHVSLIDSLFTMTSAVCVTGLAVNDIGTHYTLFGQVVILLGIQAGGIGIMTLGAAALALGRDTALRTQARYARVHETQSLRELRSIVRTVIGSTLVIELAGTLLLAWLWHDDVGLQGRSILWLAAFHTISAFCNAGFALFPDSLARFAGDPATQGVIMALIVLGGLGFPVYLELFRRARERIAAWRGPDSVVCRRLGLEARVVLVTTAILLAGGAVVFAALEWGRAFESLAPVERAFSALFTSVTARTAGFATVDIGTMRSTTWIVIMVLMWVGASPSSTGGGIKTSAAAVLFATFVGELRGHLPRLGQRTVGDTTIRRAVVVALLSLAAFALVTVGLTLTEDLPPLPLAFEAMSALTTTGLSTGITSSVTDAGRVLLVLAMFTGRLGPVTLALAIGGARRREPYRMPAQELQVW
ncbi:MAG: hypothetical protein IPJ77_10300 [Planctomycetes bacterium]|nr:hypothetical protein [Planctomycetota bacterium]